MLRRPIAERPGAMRCQPRAVHRTAAPALRWHLAEPVPTHFRRSPAAANPGPTRPPAAPANRTPRCPLATRVAATEAARATALQTAFACASRDQSPQFPITAAFPLLGTLSPSR